MSGAAISSDCLTCNVCERPQGIEQADRLFRVPSNVRAFRDEVFTLWRCRNCNSIHCKESVDLDRYYQDYPIHSQQADFFTRVGMRNRLRILTRLGLTRGQRVLDYGCGNGIFVDYLRAKGFDAHAYDPYTPRFADRSRLGTFDALINQDVIEHVDDPQTLVGEFARLLNPNGLMFVGTPNADGIDASQHHVMELHQPYHRHILSENALEYVCAKAGFRRMGDHQHNYSHTWAPFLNMHFMRAYIGSQGGALDSLFERPDYLRILTSPRLLFLAFYGGLFAAPGHMIVAFQLDAR